MYTKYTTRRQQRRLDKFTSTATWWSTLSILFVFSISLSFSLYVFQKQKTTSRGLNVVYKVTKLQSMPLPCNDVCSVVTKVLPASQYSKKGKFKNSVFLN